jgi:uncharacterized membrane protein
MAGSLFLNWIELTVIGIELLAVLIIVVAIAYATLRYLYEVVLRKQVREKYQHYRRGLAQAILMGLELLIAADVINTVALDRSIPAVVVLGLLVTIRIVLSWSLTVEINNRWPWQPKPKTSPENEDI